MGLAKHYPHASVCYHVAVLLAYTVMGDAVAQFTVKGTFRPRGAKAYPFQLCYGENVVNALGEDVVIPVTLEFNVRELHEYLYPGLSYEPSAAVTEYSDYIARKSGYDEDMIGYVLNQGPGAEADSVIAGD